MKKCPYHDLPYDGSHRREDGTERRWRNSPYGKSNPCIIACTCGKGEMPCDHTWEYQPTEDDVNIQGHQYCTKCDAVEDLES